VLAPVTASGVVLDSPEASMLLSTLAIASCNTECSLPSFVPVHDPSRKAFIGFQHGPRATRTGAGSGSGRGMRSGPGAGGGTVGGVGAGGVGDYLFHYEADRITSNVPQNLLSLDGLYYLFAFKLVKQGWARVGGWGAVGDYLFHYEADRITSNVPQNLLSLDGLYYLFAFKLIAELPSTVASVSPDVTVAMRIRYRLLYWGSPFIRIAELPSTVASVSPDVTVAMRIRYRLRYWGSPDAPPPSKTRPAEAGAGAGSEEGAGAGVEEEDEFWGQERAWDEGMAWSVWHSVDDPVKGFELVATWKELRASSSSGMAQMEQLDATTADEWLLRALLAPTRTDFDSDDPPQGFAGRLHALLGAYVVSTTGQYMEDFIAAQNFARRNNMTIPPPSVMERVVKDLFHSRSRGEGAAGAGAEGGGAEGAGGEGVEENGLSGKFKGATHIGKAAPVDSLFSRLALHVLRFGTCNIRSVAGIYSRAAVKLPRGEEAACAYDAAVIKRDGPDAMNNATMTLAASPLVALSSLTLCPLALPSGPLSAVAALWLEFTRELRWNWEQALPIPRVIADGPQHRHLPHPPEAAAAPEPLQECIKRRRKQQEREMEERMRHAERMHQIAAAKLVGERVEELVRGTALDDGPARADSPPGRGGRRRGSGRERGGRGSDRRGGRDEEEWEGMERSGSEGGGWHDGRAGRGRGGRGWDNGDGASPYHDDKTASGDSDTHGSHDVAFYDEGGVADGDSPSHRSEEDLDEYFSESDVSDDDTWAERGRTSHGLTGAMARGRRRVRRRGVVGPVKGDMWLLRVRRRMLEPHTQDPVFMSEDMIEEKERAMEALGSTPAGVVGLVKGDMWLLRVRRRMLEPHTQDPTFMSEELIEEKERAMEALGSAPAVRRHVGVQSCKPRAVLEDFVRWHSPNDWLPITSADEGSDDVDDYDDEYDDGGRRYGRDDDDRYGRGDRYEDREDRYRRGGGNRYGRGEEERYRRDDSLRDRDDSFRDASGRFSDSGRYGESGREREREREREEGREYGGGGKSSREGDSDLDPDGTRGGNEEKESSPSRRRSSSPGKDKEEEDEFFEAAQEEKSGDTVAGEGQAAGAGGDAGKEDGVEKVEDGEKGGEEEKGEEVGESVADGGKGVEKEGVKEIEVEGGSGDEPRVEGSKKAVEKGEREEDRDNSDRERERDESDRERGRDREELKRREEERERRDDRDDRYRDDRDRDDRDDYDERDWRDDDVRRRGGRRDSEEHERGGRRGGRGEGAAVGGGSGRGAGGAGGSRRRRHRVDGSGWPPRGRLSERMEEVHGNLWRELWDSAEPEPAHEQRPIFHFDLEGEKMLLYLDTVVPEELLGQLLEMIHLIHLLTHPTPPHQILILHHLDTVVPEELTGQLVATQTLTLCTPPSPFFAPHPPAPHRTLLHPPPPHQILHYLDTVILHYLDTVVPEELLGQLLATCFSSAVLLLGRDQGGARGAGCGAEAARGGHGFQHVAVAGRSALAVGSDELVEDLEVLLRAFTRMEATAMVAASLWKRLQGLLTAGGQTAGRSIRSEPQIISAPLGPSSPLSPCQNPPSPSFSPLLPSALPLPSSPPVSLPSTTPHSFPSFQSALPNHRSRQPNGRMAGRG
ncbi:unnamed protein product, partial [Closterium sp. Naga37s-1]